jgi:hypothetical protein
MVSDDALHARLAGNTRKIAAKYDVEKLAERVLGHLGITSETRNR